jgi:hypothetical protein
MKPNSSLEEQLRIARTTGYTIPADLDAQTRALQGMGQTSKILDRLYWENVAVRSAFALPDMMARSQGLAFSLTNPLYTASNAIQTSTTYRDQLYQSRALMGSRGVDESSMRGFSAELTNIGRTKSELLGVMQELASLTGTVAENLDESAKNVLTFSRATGLSQQVFTQAFGMAARGSALDRSPGGQLTMLQNAMQLVGGRREDMVLMPQMLAGLESIREGTRMSGTVPVAGAGGVENAHHVMAKMQALNPTLYRDRPDIAAQHASTITGLGRGPLLAVAMEIARRRGGTGKDGRGAITFERVLADLNSGDKEMLRGMMSFLSENPGMREYMALNGMLPPGLSVQLGENPDAADAMFTPDKSKLSTVFQTMTGFRGAAQDATTRRDRANARFLNGFQDTASFTARALNTFNGVVGSVADSAFTIGSGAWGLKQTYGFLYGRRLRKARKAAKEARRAAKANGGLLDQYGSPIGGPGGSGGLVDAFGTAVDVGLAASMLKGSFGRKVLNAGRALNKGRAALATRALAMRGLAMGGLKMIAAAPALPFVALAAGGYAAIEATNYAWNRRIDARDRESQQQYEPVLEAIQRRAQVQARAEGLRSVDRHLPGRGTDDYLGLDDDAQKVLRMIRDGARRHGHSFETKLTWADDQRVAHDHDHPLASSRDHPLGRSVDVNTDAPDWIREQLKPFGGQLHGIGNGLYHMHLPQMADTLQSTADSLKSLAFRTDSTKMAFNRTYKDQVGF